MYLEAFSSAKDPALKQRNEDRICTGPGGYFAVIDGVTDKSGRPLPDGSSRGQEAGRLIERTLYDLATEGSLFDVPLALLLERLEINFQNRYRELGELAEASETPNLRFGAQLALAVPGTAGTDGTSGTAGIGGTEAGSRAWRLVVVGDCGIRIDGDRTLGTPQVAESVLAAWRAMVVKQALANGAAVQRALDCGRHYCLAGTAGFEPKWEAELSRPEFESLRSTARRELLGLARGLPSGTLDEILSAGVLGAARYRNTAGELGQACIDGFTVPPEKVVEEVVAENASEAASFELFSDGYFGTPPAGATTVTDWEAHIAKVEREDPYKIGAYPATKGSSKDKFTDDRTVVIVKPRPRLSGVRYTSELPGITPTGGTDVAE